MRNRIFWIFALAILLITYNFKDASALQVKDNYAEGEVLVTMSGSYSVSAFNISDTEDQTKNITARMSMAAPAGTKTINTYNNLSTGTGKTVALLKSETNTTEELITEISSKPGVEAVYPNYKRETCDTTPNDFIYGKGIQWGAAASGLTKVWDITKGNSDVVVGIIDTGLKYDHHDLAGNIATVTGLTGKYSDLNNAHGAWFEGSGTGKWKIGDTLGNDISTYDEAKMQGKAASYSDRRFFGDINGHGTHVAGIIGGKGNNGIGIAGTAWNVTLLPVNVFTLGSGKAEDEGAYDSDIVRGLEYFLEVQQNSNYKGKLKVINMSIGGWNNKMQNPESNAVAVAMKKLDEAGVIICIAAGNSGRNFNRQTGLTIGKQFYPAAFARSAKIENAVVVGNARRTVSGGFIIDSTSNYSNPDSRDMECYVDIFAPGREIISTVPCYGPTGQKRVRRYADANEALPAHLQTLKDPSDRGYEGYQNMSGTSMASPMVAGSVALLCSQYPASTAKEIKSMLLAGADGRSMKKAYSLCGMLDTFSALKYGEPIKSVNQAAYNMSPEKISDFINTGDGGKGISYDLACTKAETLGEREKKNSTVYGVKSLPLVVTGSAANALNMAAAPEKTEYILKGSVIGETAANFRLATLDKEGKEGLPLTCSKNGEDGTYSIRLRNTGSLIDCSSKIDKNEDYILTICTSDNGSFDIEQNLGATANAAFMYRIALPQESQAAAPDTNSEAVWAVSANQISDMIVSDSGTAPDTGGASSEGEGGGGCSAGFEMIMLIAALPLISLMFRRKNLGNS